MVPKWVNLMACLFRANFCLAKDALGKTLSAPESILFAFLTVGAPAATCLFSVLFLFQTPTTRAFLLLPLPPLDIWSSQPVPCRRGGGCCCCSFNVHRQTLIVHVSCVHLSLILQVQQTETFSHADLHLLYLCGSP